MAKRYDVKITLESQLSQCPAGHKVGDQWTVGRYTPGGMCMGAYGALLQYVTTLRFGGSFPWEKDPDRGTFCCPDPKVVNVFRLERIEPGQKD
ncbi:MAG: TIGR04076 family protein [candidate division Zixibacteria bacterium]|nr:TIGR04076 family protein [candidate division Zixibacteria bacterium]